MSLISILFPISLYLNILQLEGYSISRFLVWLKHNFSTRAVSQKRKLALTFKTKILLVFSFASIIVLFLLLYFLSRSIYLAIFITLLLSTQVYLFLILARILLYPFEVVIIKFWFLRTQHKIAGLNKLRVIAITGSYAKTTTKELLYQLIKDKFKTLRTPQSYNTLLGIAKVVNFELDDSYDFFICELAAYHKTDVKKLCKMTSPTFGMITGITTQHLERFGSLRNIIKTKFELYDFIHKKQNMIFNLGDNNVKDETEKRNILKPTGYLTTKNVSFSKEGSEFDLIYKDAKYHLKTNLFGLSNLQNLTGAISMALTLGVGIDQITDKVSNLEPVENRFKLKAYGNSTLVDNTYSSNQKAFTQTIKTAKLLSGKKILVTPGLVELGKKEKQINRHLGKISSGVFDELILVGKNKRTNSFFNGYKGRIKFIKDTRKDYHKELEKLKEKYDWIFLENDITQNY